MPNHRSLFPSSPSIPRWPSAVVSTSRAAEVCGPGSAASAHRAQGAQVLTSRFKSKETFSLKDSTHLVPRDVYASQTLWSPWCPVGYRHVARIMDPRALLSSPATYRLVRNYTGQTSLLLMLRLPGEFQRGKISQSAILCDYMIAAGSLAW